MKKLIVAILLTCFTLPALAQSGVFYDDERKGEGVTVFEWVDLHGDTQITFYFYTYHGNDDQRWLLGSDEYDAESSSSTGLLYETEGENYPVGIPSNEPFEEDVMIVGEPFEIGTYVLRKAKDGGYLLWVSRLVKPETLENGDYLYDRTFYFTTPLLQIK